MTVMNITDLINTVLRHTAFNFWFILGAAIFQSGWCLKIVNAGAACQSGDSERRCLANANGSWPLMDRAGEITFRVHG